jgi:ribosomal-protein-alanine N-acetyltransferase
MFFIESERLKLIPLNYDQLLLYANDRPALEQSLLLNKSTMVIDTHYQQEINEALKNFWLPNTKTYPDLYHWYTNWEIVLKSINTPIGSIAFGGYPDDHGETTMGYLIDQHHWGQGYATEAVVTLSKWGFSSSLLKIINADTDRGNKASQQVLLKAGFKVTHTNQEKAHFKLTKQRHA